MATQTNQAPSVGAEQIRALRTEAAQAGDHAQVLICDRALGAVELDSDTPIEGLRVAAWVSPRDLRRIAALSDDECWQACAEAISLSAEAKQP